MLRIEPVEERGAGAADMKEAGRRGGEADDDGHGGNAGQRSGGRCVAYRPRGVMAAPIPATWQCATVASTKLLVIARSINYECKSLAFASVRSGAPMSLSRHLIALRRSPGAAVSLTGSVAA